jgi:hypothetical protein
MPLTDLLPGVRPDACPPRVVATTRSEIARARFRATAHDVAQLFLLAGVDYFFAQHPTVHIPMLNRADSFTILAALNAAVLTHVILSRVMPKWTARRIASTWCLRERARFFADERGEQPSH